jgi:GTP cyclohydrolase I
MAPSEDGVIPSHKRSQDAASISGSSTSSDDSARRRKRRERKERKRKNGETTVAAVNGAKPNAFSQRRNSLAKASRDPRDEPMPKKRRASVVPEEGSAVVKTSRSPSPVIDFDGLSRPSMFLRY